MRVLHLPIEPYPNRYTADWIGDFEGAFKQEGVECRTILGDRLGSEIAVGNVLDACGTNYWKATQIAKLMAMFNSGEVQDGDVVFAADLWFPGLEAIPYTASLVGLKVPVTGVFHAGTYDTADFTYRAGMAPWGQHLEKAWIDIAETVFMGSQFHVELIRQARGGEPGKYVVTGLPLNVSAMRETSGYGFVAKKDMVVFPHRLDPEKQLGVFLELAREVSKRRDGVTFMICSPRVPSKEDLLLVEEADRDMRGGCSIKIRWGLTRKEYFRVLAESKVVFSSALQETFGYAVAEAVALGCHPVVPDRLSYATMYPENYRYKGRALVTPDKRNVEGQALTMPTQDAAKERALVEFSHGAVEGQALVELAEATEKCIAGLLHPEPPFASVEPYEGAACRMVQELVRRYGS